MNVPHTISRVLIVANLAKNDAQGLVDEIQVYLRNKGLEVTVLSFRGKPQVPDIGQYDMAFSLGGDGTVLFCARILQEKKIPILPVNLGNFGFITEIPKSEWKDAYEKYILGNLHIGERIMLRIRIFRDEKEIQSLTALNDMVIGSAGISKIVNLSVCLSKLPIVRYRADGVIVSTPTGSTAYSAAAGGPILHPEMAALILIPICPFTLSHRPLVIPPQEFIGISVDAEQRTEIILTADGQVVFPLKPFDRITVEVDPVKIQLIQTDRRNFYSVLKAKLNWSGGPDA
jgi:NAD+ kinase